MKPDKIRDMPFNDYHKKWREDNCEKVSSYNKKHYYKKYASKEGIEKLEGKITRLNNLLEDAKKTLEFDSYIEKTERKSYV